MDNKSWIHHSVFSLSIYPVVIQTNYAAGTLAMLDMFRLSKFAFREVGVHGVWNLLSLYPDIHI